LARAAPHYRHNQNLLIAPEVSASGVVRVDKLFFAIMAGSLVFFLAMSAFIVSL